MASSQKKSGTVSRGKSAVRKAAQRVTRGGTASTEAKPAKGAAAKKTSTKNEPAKKAATKKTAPAKKTAAKKAAPAKKTAAKKTAAKKAAPAKKAATKKTATKKTATKKSATKKSAAKKAAPAKKTAAKKTAAKKTAAKKAAPAKKTATKKTATKKSAAKKAAPAKKTAAKKASAGPATNAQLAKPLAVLENESPWSAAELGEVRGDLESERTRLRGEIERAESDLRTLLRDGVDGAGNDQADVGSNSLERDAEMSLAHSHRELLRQTEHALGRIYEGTYGSCESCGNPIGKMRLMAFPRATLCMTCKQREERR